MKNKSRYAKLVSGFFFLSSIVFAGENAINEVKVREEFYPKELKNEFQKNLDFFKDGVGVDSEAGVPYDTVAIKDGKPEGAKYVNTTEIGLYLNILTEMEKTGDSKALKRIDLVLNQLEAAPKWKGLFYWPYDIRDGKLVKSNSNIVPVVDNGNLSFALAGVAGAYLDSDSPEKQEIVKKIERILEAQNEGYATLYDKGRKLLYSGWDTGSNTALAYHIDRKANESRTGALWAILATQNMGKNRVPDKAFENMHLYTGKYEINGKEYNPILPWDGSVFQVTLPTIWIKEKELIPNYKEMFNDFLSLQIYFASRKKVPALISASATVDDGYAAYGVPFVSESKMRYNNQIHEGDTGTPHASALAYIINPEIGINLIKSLKSKYPEIETPYGWYDAINSKGETSSKILSLDQGMFVGAFLEPSISDDVEKYIKHKNWDEKLVELYKSYVPNN